MNKATHTLKALVETLRNGNVSERGKCTALTVAYHALRDIYSRETANAVLWSVCETCHHMGMKFSPLVADRVSELTAELSADSIPVWDWDC